MNNNNDTMLNRKKNNPKKTRTRPEQGKTHAIDDADKARTSKSLKKALFRGFVHDPRGGRAQNLRTRLTEKAADKAGTAAHFAGTLRWRSGQGTDKAGQGSGQGCPRSPCGLKNLTAWDRLQTRLSGQGSGQGSGQAPDKPLCAQGGACSHKVFLFSSI